MFVSSVVSIVIPPDAGPAAFPPPVIFFAIRVIYCSTYASSAASSASTSSPSQPASPPASPLPFLWNHQAEFLLPVLQPVELHTRVVGRPQLRLWNLVRKRRLF